MVGLTDKRDFVIKSPDPESTCIDLTNYDDGEIIIEKSVGVKPKQRWRNRSPRMPSNNLDATIVIDDDRLTIFLDKQ